MSIKNKTVAALFLNLVLVFYMKSVDNFSKSYKKQLNQ